jgi:hypothetical protein
LQNIDEVDQAADVFCGRTFWLLTSPEKLAEINSVVQGDR